MNIIAITTYKGTNKTKLKKLLLSLILKPKISIDTTEYIYKVKELINKNNGDIIKVNQKMREFTKFKNAIFCTQDSIIVPTLHIKSQLKRSIIPQIYYQVPDRKLNNMYQWLLDNKFEPVQEKNIKIEILQDGLFDSKIIKEFKKLYNNIEVVGTVTKANLMVQRNICLERHHDNYIKFCDDDDLSADLDTLRRMFDECKGVKEGKIRLFKTCGMFRRGFWGVILCPGMKNFVDISTVYQEDYKYLLKNKDDWQISNDPEDIYYYLGASEREYKIGINKVVEMPKSYLYSDGKTYYAKKWDDSEEVKKKIKDLLEKQKMIY